MQHAAKLFCVLILVFTVGCVFALSDPNISKYPTPQPLSATSTTPIIAKPSPTKLQVEIMVETPSITKEPTLAIATDTPQKAPNLSPDTWQNMPIVPEVSDSVLAIYRKGLELGNNPRAFSKVGDCGSTPAWFLGNFDLSEKYYSLGDHQYLKPIIQEFQGSFERTSLAAKSGFNASSIFAPIWANREYCFPGESPLECEYRTHRPMFAIITLGTNDIWHQEDFEPQMRKIIETSIENGIIPILSTKADNLEGDHYINATIAKLAIEYDIPLWNYWLAVQPLPNHGLQKDGAHLTWGPTKFDDPQALQTAWTIRNLTALQVLDVVWQEASAP